MRRQSQRQGRLIVTLGVVLTAWLMAGSVAPRASAQDGGDNVETGQGSVPCPDADALTLCNEHARSRSDRVCPPRRHPLRRHPLRR